MNIGTNEGWKGAMKTVEELQDLLLELEVCSVVAPEQLRLKRSEPSSGHSKQ